jgi:agmatinase
MIAYTPNQVGRVNQGIFGLPHTPEDAEVVIIPIPWDATTSGREGTAAAPKAIMAASPQLDLYHPDFSELWQEGIAMAPHSSDIQTLNQATRKETVQVISALETGQEWTDSLNKILQKVNKASQTVNQLIQRTIEEWVDQNKLVIVLGGDHSVSVPYIQFIAERCEQFGVLQLDAHMDLRQAYCGFDYSHASAMTHIIQLPSVSRLVQVGVRDYCDEEVMASKQSRGKVKTIFDRDINNYLFTGKTWDFVCKKIINALPERVYISIDIDALAPSLCPHTGTPVPGGLTYNQVSYLLEKLAKSNKKIIGCDLVEVGNDPWDANVGARLLYQLCGWFWASAEDT